MVYINLNNVDAVLKLRNRGFTSFANKNVNLGFAYQ